jgi:WYL domain
MGLTFIVKPSFFQFGVQGTPRKSTALSIEKSLREAIKSRTVLEVYYSTGSRLIEPHCLGWSKDGNMLLRAYQTEGASESGEHTNWKLMRVDKMGSAKPTNDNFERPRPEYNPDDKAMKGGFIERL